jgi:mannose-1-phosphate guanylyltransferase/phosphomannomutase
VKAIVLCAGMGTRLGQLTCETPKPLLPLHGHPLLAFTIAHLARQGFREIGINLHYLPGKIVEFLGDGSRFGVSIHYSFEGSLMGTAGALKLFESFLNGADEFLVQYGDILTDQNFRSMVAFHREHRALATLLLHQRSRSNSIVDLDESERVTGFWERPDEETRSRLASHWVNSGICVLDTAVLAQIPHDTVCDLPKDIYTGLVNTRRLFGFPLSGYRCAIDSPERYREAEAAVVERRWFEHLP